jgi:AcrR family transcriptional regulator
MAPAREEVAPAREGMGPERVLEIQHARILAAMVHVSAQRGAANVTVAHVVERAGVSRRTFYEIFTGCEECLLAALEDAISRARRYALEDYDPHAAWAERIRTVLTGLLAFLDQEPGTGRLLIVGSLEAGTTALERRRRLLDQIITAIDEGRRTKTDQGRTKTTTGPGPPPLTAEGTIGGVLSVLHTRLTEETTEPLTELTAPLMSMIVLPYLGPAAARKELEQPAPARPPANQYAASDPLRDLGMRLTYRTVRVLLSIAQAPGSSNREIGTAAEVTDQGQISKLLTRLQRFGLIHNTGLGPGTGAPNAWTLTQQGWTIQTMIAQQTHHNT